MTAPTAKPPSVVPASKPPSAAPAQARRPDKRLQLDDVLKLMLADGMVSAAEAERVRRVGPAGLRDPHPLVVIAEQKCRDARAPHRPLQLEGLTEWLAGKLGVPYQHIDPLRVDFSAVTAVISNAYAERYRILPVAVTRDTLTVATAEPFVTSWADELEPVLKLKIRLVFANPLDITRYLVEFYNLARSIRRAGEGQKGEVSLTTNFEQLVELGQRGAIDANDRHVIHIVDWLWQYAFEQRASDIHLEPRRDLGIVRFRIDGHLHQAYQIPPTVFQAMTSRIKLLARMEIVDRRRPQDGRIKTLTPAGEEVELRVSTMPTAFGEKVVMRVFNPDVSVRTLGDLGFSEEDVQRWQGMVGQPTGIVLVTGPTGSGKTTTLYSTLRQLATPDVNVCTIEDPIEMIEPSFNQMQVQPVIGVDFPNGVRTLLRQDPDIIMVGEIRDLPTAEMAIQAALTGHLVLSTLHTNDAPSAITRALDVGVPAYLINATMIGVMAQRLVRTLCPHCKRDDGELDARTWRQLNAPWEAPMPSRVFRPAGCLECRMTGYLGRVGIYEIMLMTQALREVIIADAEVARIRDQAFRDGMRPLRASGALKVAAGLTTAEEVLKVAPPL